MSSNAIQKTDVVLIGAGIMSATLGIFLKELNPSLRISIYERMDEVAIESSDAWNNAGTGHSAFCELNYTPLQTDGSIDISKAIKIASSFETSKQFWSYLIETKKIAADNSFISCVPHSSFVWGEENVAYLKKRYESLIENPLFEGMQYSENWNEIESWMPLVMEGRDKTQKIAATKMQAGTDVNFGALTRAMIHYLQSLDDVQLFLNHEVRNLEFNSATSITFGSTQGTDVLTNYWDIKVKDLTTNEKHHIHAPFVFIGAGGGALPLLEKSDIKEAEGFGGFPISGQFLRCTNSYIISQHKAKVYGKASVGAPPMSVPHLDTRIINDKQELLFGPYAGFSTKFLKNGSYFDLTESIEFDNIFPMLSAGWHNMPLTKYLINQVRQSHEDRVEALKEYFPNADAKDWELIVAGQRVQVIKKDEEEGGVLEFGTEIVASEDGSLVALLGASPGASTAVSVMLDVLKKCFSQQLTSADWQTKIKIMVPTYHQDLATNKELCVKTRQRSKDILGL